MIVGSGLWHHLITDAQSEFLKLGSGHLKDENENIKSNSHLYFETRDFNIFERI